MFCSKGQITTSLCSKGQITTSLYKDWSAALNRGHVLDVYAYLSLLYISLVGINT